MHVCHLLLFELRTSFWRMNTVQQRGVVFLGSLLQHFYIILWQTSSYSGLDGGPAFPRYGSDDGGRWFLPDVLSGPGLHHNPHLQLLCALRHHRTKKADTLRLQAPRRDRARGLTSSDSRRSSVSSTCTTASAPQGMGAPVVTLITWPGIIVWVGYKHRHTSTEGSSRSGWSTPTMTDAMLHVR